MQIPDTIPRQLSSSLVLLRKVLVALARSSQIRGEII
jgi:hypothetical protein